jgi:formylglycine-generating enzyme required for sulfatase activity
VTLDMVWVKGGTFKMGSPESEKERSPTEGPQTEVTLQGFSMGKTEVTQEQYGRVMATNPSEFKGPKNPVETVSWNDAMEFCKKLSSASKAGRTYALPTEAQWEYACRAGSAGRFGFGDSDSDLDNYAWILNNSGSMTHPVGQKTANKIGDRLEWH